jgi:hypothetical protein
MIVSVRLPAVSPVVSLAFSSSVSPSRLSEPTISQFVPAAAAGRPG